MTTPAPLASMTMKTITIMMIVMVRLDYDADGDGDDLNGDDENDEAFEAVIPSGDH